MPERKVHPVDLQLLLDKRPPRHPVAFDTETSGLFVDAGARVSTVSVAWILDEDEVAGWVEELGGVLGTDQYLWGTGIWTLRREVTAGARSNGWAKGDWAQQDWVLSFAWPFDQGARGTGKPEDDTAAVVAHGQGGLLGQIDGWTPDKPPADSENLGHAEWTALCGWLVQVGRRVGLTAHNAKFDIHIMEKGPRWHPGRGVDLLSVVDWDTQGGADLWVAWRTSDVGKPTTSLKPNAQWLWGVSEGDEKAVISRYLKRMKLPPGRWDLMPWDVIAKYADQDARLTARYRKWQEVEAKRVKSASGGRQYAEYGWTVGTGGKGFQRRMDTMRMLVKVERRGLPFNASVARREVVEIDRRIAEVEAKLAAELGGQVTLPMAKHYWFGSGDKLSNEKVDVRGHGYEAYAVTEGGEPVVDIATLAKMHRDGLPLVQEWMDYKRLTDAKSRWYEGWTSRAGEDGRLRTGFRQNGTASGRFSVEEIQLQAIPADYKVKGGPLAGLATPRDLIEAGVPDGYELWEMDLAQAELRVAAQMAGCQRMLSAIAEGRDLHGETATALFGVTPDSEDWGMYRQVAKRGNFSLIFGVGWKTFRDTLWKEAGVDWGEQETRAMITAWNALYPEYKVAIAQHERVVMNRYGKHGIGWIEDRATSERRWFTKWDVEYYNPERQRMEKGAHKAFNQRVQPSLAQYGIDRWLAEEEWLEARYRGTKHEKVGAGLVLMVHDSSVLLLPEDDGEEVTATLSKMGTDLWARRFPGLPGGLDATRWASHA